MPLVVIVTPYFYKIAKPILSKSRRPTDRITLRTKAQYLTAANQVLIQGLPLQKVCTTYLRTTRPDKIIALCTKLAKRISHCRIRQWMLHPSHLTPRRMYPLPIPQLQIATNAKTKKFHHKSGTPRRWHQKRGIPELVCIFMCTAIQELIYPS